jgi:hypothetical protein
MSFYLFFEIFTPALYVYEYSKYIFHACDISISIMATSKSCFTVLHHNFVLVLAFPAPFITLPLELQCCTVFAMTKFSLFYIGNYLLFLVRSRNRFRISYILLVLYGVHPTKTEVWDPSSQIHSPWLRRSSQLRRRVVVQARQATLAAGTVRQPYAGVNFFHQLGTTNLATGCIAEVVHTC